MGNVDRPHIFHALLAFFLLFKQLAFPSDVSAVALGGHVLSHGFDGFTGNDLSTNGRLQRDFKLVPIDFFLELAQDGPGAVFRAFAVANQAEGFDLFAVHQDLHLGQLVDPVFHQLVVHGAVAVGHAFQLVVEVEDDFGQWHLVVEDGAFLRKNFLVTEDATAGVAQFDQVANRFVGADDFEFDDGLPDGLHGVGVGKVGRVMDLQLAAIFEVDLVRHGGGGLNNLDFAFAFQAFLHDVHVQHAQEAAAEPKAKGFRVLHFKGEG